MYIAPFPECCGGAVAAAFGGTIRQLGGTAQYPPAEIRTFLTRCDGQLNSKGFVMIVLNNDQVPYMRPYLKEFGYKRIAKDIPNPTHRKEKSLMYIYIKRKRVEEE